MFDLTLVIPIRENKASHRKIKLMQNKSKNTKIVRELVPGQNVDLNVIGDFCAVNETNVFSVKDQVVKR